MDCIILMSHASCPLFASLTLALMHFTEGASFNLLSSKLWFHFSNHARCRLDIWFFFFCNQEVTTELWQHLRCQWALVWAYVLWLALIRTIGMIWLCKHSGSNLDGKWMILQGLEVESTFNSVWQSVIRVNEPWGILLQLKLLPQLMDY